MARYFGISADGLDALVMALFITPLTLRSFILDPDEQPTSSGLGCNLSMCVLANCLGPRALARSLMGLALSSWSHQIRPFISPLAKMELV
jgi:hypothetical protein